MARNSLSQLLLQIRDIADVAFKVLGPQMAIMARIDEANSYPRLVVGELHGALHHGIDIELPGNVRQPKEAALEPHHGCTRNDPESFDPCEMANEFVGQSVCPVLLI